MRPGRGVEAVAAGEMLLAGNAALLEEAGIALPPEAEKAAQICREEGCTVIFVAAGGEAVGLLALADTLRTDAADTQADYYLVLGALVNPDGQPSAALAARCDTAADLLAANPDSKAVLCGGQGGNEPCTEADAMYAYLTEQKGVDPARLLREDRSTNTIENLANARALIESAEARTHGDYTAAVVTSDYHLARAKVLLRRAGYEEGLGVPAPTPYPGQWVAVRCREYCSILGLMLSGRWTA